MDYNEFAWSAVAAKPNYLQATLKHIPILIPLGLILGGVAYFVSQNQRLIISNQLFLLLLAITAIILAVVNTIWFIVSNSSGPKVIDCKIDSSGISIGDRTIEFNSIKPLAKKTIKEKSIPYDQWDKHNLEHRQVNFSLPTKRGKVTLMFANTYDQQKLLRSLSEHLQ